LYIGGVPLLSKLDKLGWEALMRNLKEKPKLIAAGLCHGGDKRKLYKILEWIHLLFGSSKNNALILMGGWCGSVKCDFNQ
jgi:hypothetical protein